MSEEEWYKRGDELLREWGDFIDPSTHLTANEESAFEYAWELAGREMGIVT